MHTAAAIDPDSGAPLGSAEGAARALEARPAAVRPVAVLERIGATPLVDLSALLPHGGDGRVRLLAKAEWTTPAAR